MVGPKAKAWDTLRPPSLQNICKKNLTLGCQHSIHTKLFIVRIGKTLPLRAMAHFYYGFNGGKINKHVDFLKMRKLFCSLCRLKIKIYVKKS